ncbi:unnamed protein product [Schistocephalus solidus]|uniref:Uncharacterized protein n=1 Tax=Schistocephalus solidus TaxID=70667 RepID=A0A183SYB7_SCHSO|nr:unnamed protein product [Schistocephalus solidus]
MCKYFVDRNGIHRLRKLSRRLHLQSENVILLLIRRFLQQASRLSEENWLADEVNPRNFGNHCIRKRDKRQNSTGPNVWRALPYVKNVSEAASRLLTPLRVGVAHRPLGRKTQCQGRKRQESCAGSGAVADKANSLEKLGDYSTRERPSIQ